MNLLLALVLSILLISCSDKGSGPTGADLISSVTLVSSESQEVSSSAISSSEMKSSSSHDLGSPTSTTPTIPNPVFGTLTTSDNAYATVVIGAQMWMAENSREAPISGRYWTYQSNSEDQGRYYDFEAAQSACPEGWHLPSIAEFNVLLGAVGGTSVAGQALKSMDLWTSVPGLNTYGFNARPSGYYDGFAMNNIGSNVSFWSTDSDPARDTFGYYLSMNVTDQTANLYSYKKSFGYSVRCLK